MLLTAQVVRGSVGSPNVMVGDRLELDACDLELVCILYLRLSKFQLSDATHTRLQQQFLHHLAGHIGQPKLTARVAVGEPFVVHPQAVE